MSTSHDMVDAATEAVKSVIDDIPRGSFMDEDMGSSQPPIRNGRAPPKVNFMGSLLEGDDEVGKAGFSSEQQEEGSREQQEDGSREQQEDGSREQPEEDWFQQEPSKDKDSKEDDDQTEDQTQVGDGEAGADTLLSLGGQVEEIEPPRKPVNVRQAFRQFREELKPDPYAALLKMRRRPHQYSMIKIPLCRLIPCDFVRPAMQSDVQKLQAEFFNGIRPGSGAFYVADTSHMGDVASVTEEMKSGWCNAWKVLNAAFEDEIRQHRETKDLTGKMFYVFDGNHRTRAWREFIEVEYPDDLEWAKANGRPDCILLDVKGSREALVTAMHAINK